MNKLTKWKLISYLVALFLAGGVTGAVLTHKLDDKRPGPRGPGGPGGRGDRGDFTLHIKEKLQTKLDLTPQQMEKIQPLLEKSGAELRKEHEESMKQFGKIIDDLNAQIVTVLTPEQKTKFEEMQKERREWEKKRFYGTNRPPEKPKFETNSVTK